MLKVLLVDDESAVLNGIKYILNKHCAEYEVLVAESGIQALEVLKTKEIDVVITDVKMPEMDGVELTKKIREFYPETVVVVLSGYSDFEYVRQCMKNGAYDYLLKPCKYQTIIDILRNIESMVYKRRLKEKETLNKKFLEDLILGKNNFPREWFMYDNIQMIVVKIQNIEDLVEEVQDYIKKLFKKFNITTGEILDAVVKENIVFISREDLPLKEVKKKLYYCRQSLFEQGFQGYIAIYSFKAESECIKNAYDLCKKMIDFLEFNEISIVLDAETYGEHIKQQEKHEFKNYFSGQLLGNYIVTGQIEKIGCYLSSNLNKFYDLNIYWEPERLRRQIIEELVLFEHTLKNYNIDIEQFFKEKINLDYLDKLQKLKTLKSLLNWLKNFVIEIAMNIKNKDNIPYYIHAAIKYIQSHYMEDLNLEKVAREVYMNPWYFSTQFKKYVGLSFSEYLNQVRVKIAKELLKQKDLKVYQVAEMVGFQDATYFSTVFKNIENISPKEYQKIVT